MDVRFSIDATDAKPDRTAFHETKRKALCVPTKPFFLHPNNVKDIIGFGESRGALLGEGPIPAPPCGDFPATPPRERASSGKGVTVGRRFHIALLTQKSQEQ